MLRRVRSDRNELNRNERPIDFSLIHLIRFLSFRTNPFKLCFVSLVWSLFSPYSFLIKIFTRNSHVQGGQRDHGALWLIANC